MPTVNLSPETYEKLKKYASSLGETPDFVAEELLGGGLGDAGLSESEYQRRWDQLLTRTRGRVAAGTSLESIENDVAEAVEAARAERLASGR